MANDHYLVLARKWRPGAFDEVVGQEHITRTLQNAIRSGRIGHAFLFIGSRGIGKTTTARILAKALNCLNAELPTPDPCGECDNCKTITAGTNIDVIEIDGASNNSVDHVREIREQIRMVPAHARYKIYIIDEVHQLSIAAFNALLKTLEEPPAHAIFVLATTEAHKIPATIISRCQRYDFRRVSIDHIAELLKKILVAEGVKCCDEAVYAIARAAEGGVRDAESILDQLMSYCEEEITFKDVFDVLGLVDWRMMHDLCDAILEKEIARQLKIVEDVVIHGKDLSQFVQDILQYFRNLLVCKTGNATNLLALPDEEIAEIQKRSDKFTLINIIRFIEQFAELTKGFDSQLAQRIALEAMMVKISRVSVEISLDTVMEKLLALSEGGLIPVSSSNKPVQTTPNVSENKPEYNPSLEKKTEFEQPALEPRRFVVSKDNMSESWERLTSHAGEDNLNLSVWLKHAIPVAVEDDILILQFPAGSNQARSIVEKADHREILRKSFIDLTENIRDFRSELTEGEREVSLEGPAKQENLLFTDHVNAKEAQTALEDPHIAKVLDVFKGKIIDIKHNVKV